MSSSTKPLVLITGPSGYLAAHVLRQLVEARYPVRGTVRSEEKGQALKKEYGNKVEYVVVEDLVTADLTEAVKGVTLIAHCASPYHFAVTDPVKDILDPAVKGTLSVLRAASKEPSVKRIVITSSTAAVLDPFQGGPYREYMYTSKDFNPSTFAQATESGRPGPFVYSASKVLAEQAAWDFPEKTFEIVTLCPPMIYGPPVHPVSSTSALNTSTANIYKLISATTDAPLPQDRLPLYADVRDVATAHLRALEVPEAGNKRFLLCGGKFGWQEAVDFLRSTYPDRQARIPTGEPGKPLGRAVAAIDVQPAKDVLGIEFKEWKETVKDTVDALLEYEKRW